MQAPHSAEIRLAFSRKVRNRRSRALRGNIKAVVANVGALSNLRLAVRSEPDVALVQELWATADEIRKVAKELGYVAAVAAGSCCHSFDRGTGSRSVCRLKANSARGLRRPSSALAADAAAATPRSTASPTPRLGRRSSSAKRSGRPWRRCGPSAEAPASLEAISMLKSRSSALSASSAGQVVPTWGRSPLASLQPPSGPGGSTKPGCHLRCRPGCRRPSCLWRKA